MTPRQDRILNRIVDYILLAILVGIVIVALWPTSGCTLTVHHVVEFRTPTPTTQPIIDQLDKEFEHEHDK